LAVVVREQLLAVLLVQSVAILFYQALHQLAAAGVRDVTMTMMALAALAVAHQVLTHIQVAQLLQAVKVMLAVILHPTAAVRAAAVLLWLVLMQQLLLVVLVETEQQTLILDHQ
jgi:hypothetical protein